jgi:hypothetical protein
MPLKGQEWLATIVTTVFLALVDFDTYHTILPLARSAAACISSTALSAPYAGDQDHLAIAMHLLCWLEICSQYLLKRDIP